MVNFKSEPKKNSRHFFYAVLLVSCWLEIDKECTKFSQQSPKVMGSRHRKSNSRYADEGKRVSMFICASWLVLGRALRWASRAFKVNIK